MNLLGGNKGFFIEATGVPSPVMIDNVNVSEALTPDEFPGKGTFVRDIVSLLPKAISV